MQALIRKGYEIVLVVCHPGNSVVREMAEEHNIATISPEEPNDIETQEYLESFDADLFALAAYGKILKQNVIDIPKLMCVNLHGGRLPQYRGSSPMNWSLINGEQSFGLSIIKVDTGVDTGDVILDRTFEISINDTICQLHEIANREFPLMLLEVVEQLKNGDYELKKQNDQDASYYPLRFPDDGLILWDILTAEQIYNRIRALTEPYPCAFTFYNGQEVKLIASHLCNHDTYGEPGRIYKKAGGKLLVCALDKCLWIEEASFRANGNSLYDSVTRYEKLATVRDTVMDNLRGNK